MSHMHDRYEHVFAPRVLLAVNLAIILSAVTVGRVFFYETGLIHVLAPMFVLLACVRIFDRYHLYDSSLKTFVGWCLPAFVLFILVRGMEFAHTVFAVGGEGVAVYGMALLLRIVALLTLGAGMAHVLGGTGMIRAANRWLAAISLMGTAALVVVIVRFTGVIARPSALAAAAFALSAGLLAVGPAYAIGRADAEMQPFGRMMTKSFALLTLGACVHALHFAAAGDAVLHRWIEVSSALLFYAAMSLLFLAFGRLPAPRPWAAK